MTDDDDKIKAVETYRGVDIHDCQPRDRIEAVVRPEIDRVLGLADALQLAGYAADVTKPPEARLLAAAMVEATFQVRADERAVRPSVSLDRVRASVAGLASRRWRDATCYASLLDSQRSPGPIPRQAEFRRQVLADDAAATPKKRRPRK